MLSKDPRYPAPWTEDTPLELLGEVEGVNPYDTGRRVPNFRLTPEPAEGEEVVTC